MIYEWIQAIGSRFSPEAYMVLTRIEGLLWTTADFVILIYLLRIANLIRRYVGQSRHRIPWGILAATVPFALLLPIAPSGTIFYRLELAVTVPHFLLILYVCIVNVQPAAAALAIYQSVYRPRKETRAENSQ